MALETWLSLLLFATVNAFSPGAGSILTVNHALQHGWRHTPMLIAGQETALALLVVAVAAGAQELLTSTPLLFALKLSGMLWMVYTAWQMWYAPVNNQQPSAGASVRSRNTPFMRGFITTAFNVKAMACLVAALPVCLTPSHPLVPQMTVMALTLVAVDTLAMLGFAVTACRFWPLSRKPDSIRLQNRLSATGLLFIAASLCFV